MEYFIKGKVHDEKNNPLDGIRVKAYDQDSIFEDDSLGYYDTKKGIFEIKFDSNDYDRFRTEGSPEVYLVLVDSDKKFEYVKDREWLYSKERDNIGQITWKGKVIGHISDIGKYDITVGLSPRKVLEEYEAVVIGSGFGGTILSLSLAEKFGRENSSGTSPEKRVCILERGQWWVSHEMPESPEGRKRKKKQSLREYLNEKNDPYSTWAYPDNLTGAFKVFGNARPINRKGVFDYRPLGNVHVICSSGVGGGSLVYTNVTERPDKSVYAKWPFPTSEGTDPLDKYFVMAKAFIGTNRITTTAGIGKFLLPRTKVFQEAARTISNTNSDLVKQDNYDAELSITEIQDSLFPGIDQPLKPEDLDPMTPQQIKDLTKSMISKYTSETNVCQRQGRCVLGCIPGARHTLNKKIENFIVVEPTKVPKPVDVHPLCHVMDIQESKKSGYKYRIRFKDYREDEDGKERIIDTKILILAAGSLGSTEILLRSKNNLQLSDKIGKQFSTNGDLLGVINPTIEKVDASRGPITTSIVRFNKSGNFSFSIEDDGIPKMFADLFAFMFNMLSERQLEQKNTGKTRKLIGDNPTGLLSKLVLNRDLNSIINTLVTGGGIPPSDTFDTIISAVKGIIKDKNIPSASAEERVYNLLMLSGIGIDDAKAELILKNNELALKEKYDLDHQVFKDIIKTMEEFAEIIGRYKKDSLLVPFWDKDPSKRTQFVLHPLGGCPMGKDASEGGVDHLGRPFKGNTGTNFYESFHVVDGSIIPSALGVNPSLTISALAFRIASAIVRNDNDLPK